MIPLSPPPALPPAAEPITGLVARISQRMSVLDIAVHLAQHGCINVTSSLDLSACSTFPLSKGGFGDVYFGRLHDGTKVAIKTMRMEPSTAASDSKAIKHAARELYVWSKCRHPNVLSLLGLAEFRGDVAMVSPWMDEGTLQQYISRNPDTDLCLMCSQICNGLAYIHGAGMVHGDLKGLNVLVSDDGAPVITDFGNAVLHNSTLGWTTTTQNTSLSLRWAAPEMLDEREETYSEAADIYALGMTILEIFSGQPPYSGKTDIAVFSAVNRKQYPARSERSIPSNSLQGDRLWNLLTRCWSFEPKDRPSAEAVASEMKEITREGLKSLPIAEEGEKS